MTTYKPNKRKAKQLGAAYKKGYPKTYLKGQRTPRFRSSRQAQRKELDRLVAASGMPRSMAIRVLKKKYENEYHEFKIRK